MMKPDLTQILVPGTTPSTISTHKFNCFAAKFELSGPESSAFLDRVVAGSVPKPGRTTLAHMLTTGGKVDIMMLMMVVMVC